MRHLPYHFKSLTTLITIDFWLLLYPCQFVKLEGLSVLDPEVVSLGKSLKIVDEVKQFFVLWRLPVKTDNGHSVRELIRKGVH